MKKKSQQYNFNVSSFFINSKSCRSVGKNIFYALKILVRIVFNKTPILSCIYSTNNPHENSTPTLPLAVANNQTESLIDQPSSRKKNSFKISINYLFS